MPNFCVNENAQSSGEHEVHNLDADCNQLPDLSNRLQLGSFSDCHGAITEAKKTYNNVDGCFYCANACHTK